MLKGESISRSISHLMHDFDIQYTNLTFDVVLIPRKIMTWGHSQALTSGYCRQLRVSVPVGGLGTQHL